MADILQEFLVGVGFKVEKAGLEAFQKALKGGATQAVAFGTIWAKVAEEAVDAASAVVKATFAMAQQLDTLYFAGIRVQDTADHVAAAGYAFSQMGSNAQAAKQALTSIADFVRTTPGALSYMQSLHIITTDEHGNPLSTEKLMENTQRMIHQMNQTQPALADQYRQMFGLSVDQMLMDPDKFDEAMDEYARIREALHLTGDASVETGHRFEHSWTRMKEVTGSFTEAFVTEYMPEMTESMNAFSDMLTGKWSEAWMHWGRAMRDQAERGQRAMERRAYDSAKLWESLGVVSHEQVIALRDSIRTRRRGTLARDRVEDAQTAAEDAELGGDDSLDEGGPAPTPKSDAAAEARRLSGVAAQAAAAAKEAAATGDRAVAARYAGIAQQAAAEAATEAATAESASGGAPAGGGVPGGGVAPGGGAPAGGGHPGGGPAADPGPQPQRQGKAQFEGSKIGSPYQNAQAFFSKLVGRPVTITAAEASGGHARHSEHYTGDAWDFKVPGMTNQQVVDKIRASGVRFDELFDEQNHVHMGFRGQSGKLGYGFGPNVTLTGHQQFGVPPAPPLMSASAAAGVTINQRTEITVNGVSDAAAAGQHVLHGQEGVNGRLARNAGQNHAY